MEAISSGNITQQELARVKKGYRVDALQALSRNSALASILASSQGLTGRNPIVFAPALHCYCFCSASLRDKLPPISSRKPDTALRLKWFKSVAIRRRLATSYSGARGAGEPPGRGYSRVCWRVVPAREPLLGLCGSSRAIAAAWDGL